MSSENNASVEWLLCVMVCAVVVNQDRHHICFKKDAFVNFYPLLRVLEPSVGAHGVLTLTRLCCLADHIDERTVCNAVSPTKDVDGFHVVNVGRMCLDQSTMLPATPWGVWEIIKRTGNRSDHLPSFRVEILLN